MLAAECLGLNCPAVIDRTFALTLPKVYDLPVLLKSAFSGLIPAGANFIMSVKVQSAANLNCTRKI